MRRTLASLASTPSVMPDRVAVAAARVFEAQRLGLASRHRHQLALINLERAAGAPLAEALKPDTPLPLR